MCCGELAAVDRPPVVLIFDAPILRQIQVPQINVEEGVLLVYPAHVGRYHYSSPRNKTDAFFWSEWITLMTSRRRRGSTTSGPFLMVAYSPSPFLLSLLLYPFPTLLSSPFTRCAHPFKAWLHPSPLLHILIPTFPAVSPFLTLTSVTTVTLLFPPHATYPLPLIRVLKLPTSFLHILIATQMPCTILSAAPLYLRLTLSRLRSH
jgi:hypothetical protein